MGKVRNKNGVLTQSNEETASCLNSYFASVFTRDNENETMPDFQNRYGSLLADIPIEERAIKKLLNDIKVDKAMGPDGISPRTLWETRGFISEALAEIFTASLKQGRIPSDWKEAIIVPIYKKGRRDMPENYRPVSLTCVISKVMEKIIRDALVSFFIDNGILSERQFGFVPGRSCTLQLLVCVEEWSRSIDDGKQIDVIYTDYSRAFDTVSHRKLMQKLHGLGVQGNMWTWIQEFLSDRKQKVRVNDGFSGWERVVSGVPQVSVLGPILFLVYINDLPEAVQAQLLKLFADDAKLYKAIDSNCDAAELQQGLGKMLEWSYGWGLRMNASKCKVLHLSRNTRTIQNEYFMKEGELLETVEFEKDLGVYVDEKMSFETHVTKSINMANKMTGIVNRNFRLMGEDVFMNLYKTLIRPHLEYASVVWSPSTIRDQRRIEGVQRRATKLVSSVSELSYHERLRKLGIPSLQYRRMRGDMLQVYKILHGIERINPDVFFELAGGTRTRGHKYKIIKQRCSTSFRLHSFSHRVVDTWNALPEHVVDSPNVNIFKTRLNTVWKNHPNKFAPSFYS